KSFAQFLLRFLDFIFLGSAAAQVFGGVFVILVFRNYKYLFHESCLSILGWLALVAELILLPIGLLAVSTSVKSSCNEQGTLMYLLLLLLCIETSSVVLAQFYSTSMASQLESTMGCLVYQHDGTCSQHPGSTAVDAMQRKLQCCGVHNYTDWLKTTAASWHLPAYVPESCCKQNYSYCRGDLGHLELLCQEGCLKKLEDRLYFVVLYVLWCCASLSLLVLLAGVSNGIFMKHQPFYDLKIL
ncbi:Tetraspanin-3, partial [Acanthisitta chloris]